MYSKNSLFRELQMVIIDEVSMVRADLMNAIDISLRKNKNKLDIPFGGVQMVFIGDLFQLPPVATDNLRMSFNNTFGGEYFFMLLFSIIILISDLKNLLIFSDKRLKNSETY